MPRPLRRIDRLRQIERPIGDAAPPPTLVGELVEHRRPSRVPALGRHAVHETPRALRRDLNAASREPSVKSDGGIALYRTDPLKIPVVALTTAVVSFTNANNFAFVSGEPQRATVGLALGLAALSISCRHLVRASLRSASVRRTNKAGWAYALFARLLWVGDNVIIAPTATLSPPSIWG